MVHRRQTEPQRFNSKSKARITEIKYRFYGQYLEMAGEENPAWVSTVVDILAVKSAFNFRYTTIALHFEFFDLHRASFF